MGYDLTKQEIEWVNEIQAKSKCDLEERKLKYDEDSILTTAIFGVTFFTRKLGIENIDESNKKTKKSN